MSFAVFLLGCSSGSGAQGPSGQTAGEVIELTGHVVAARAKAQPRPLAVGAAVFSDDTITTDQGASVLIKLSHNNAAWRLDEGRSRRVDQSLAWKAPRQESGSVLEGQGTDDRTAAAGRHSEHEAAQTRATAMADRPAAAADEAPTEAAPTPPPAAQPVRPHPAPSHRRPRRKRRHSSHSSHSSRASSHALPPAADSAPLREVAPAKASAPPPPAPAPEPEAAPRSAPGGSRGRAVDPDSAIRGKIKVCYALADGAPAGSVIAVVTINASGVITSAKVSAASGLAKVAGCARKKLTGLHIAGAKAGVHKVSVKLR